MLAKDFEQNVLQDFYKRSRFLLDPCSIYTSISIIILPIFQDTIRLFLIHASCPFCRKNQANRHFKLNILPYTHYWSAILSSSRNLFHDNRAPLLKILEHGNQNWSIFTMAWCSLNSLATLMKTRFEVSHIVYIDINFCCSNWNYT